MDETALEATHDLLLDMAGRVDDDLLAWARELAAVGETQHALELIGATLAADRTGLPGPTRAALVEAARSVRTELDADRALAAPVAADGRTPHRFDAAPTPAVLAAVRALPARLLVGCRVQLANRVTPAGSAPGPLPHPVVLVEVSLGARNRDVLAYQLADALDRAGVRASVEVISTEQQLPAYHVEALRCARPVPPAEPDGGQASRSARSDAPPSRAERPTEPGPQPVPLRVAAARTAVTVEHIPGGPAWDEPVRNAVWAGPDTPNGAAASEAAWSDSSVAEHAGSVEPAPARSAPRVAAPGPEPADSGDVDSGDVDVDSTASDSPAPESPAPASESDDTDRSDPARTEAVGATPTDHAAADRAAADPAAADSTVSGATTPGLAPEEPGVPGSAASRPTEPEPTEPDPTEPDPTVSTPTSTGPEPAEPPARNYLDGPRAEPITPDHRPGPRPIADWTPRRSVPRNASPDHDPEPANMWIVSDGAEPVTPPPGVPRPAVDQTALTALPQRRRPEPSGAASTARIDAASHLARERRHRYLIESSEQGPTSEADQVGATGPNGTGHHPMVRAEGGNTEPLIIRPPVQRHSPDPHPADRANPGGGAGIFAVDAGDRAAPPAGQLPGEPAPSDLGLRPESVARLSESGRELLARLQAELQGSGTGLGPRPGGPGPNGGNGTGPQPRVDPPDMAG